MTAPLLLSTPPREIEPRWIHAGDQIAVMATHYDPAHEVTPVRTTDLAKVDNLVSWWRVVCDPVHPDAADIGSGPLPRYPLSGFRLLLDPGPDDGELVELFTREHEQLVIREQVSVEPWDIACAKPLPEGVCYMPAGHPGDCDPDSDGATTERLPDLEAPAA